jgi:hypothetical protein
VEGRSDGTHEAVPVIRRLIAQPAEQIRTLSFSEQYPDWELAAVTFFAAFLIGYLALEPPYRKKK